MNEQQRYEEYLERVSRFRNLLGGLLSEVGTPITVIRGYSDLLLHGEAGVLTDKQQEYVTYINRSATYVGRIKQQLLILCSTVLYNYTINSELVDVKEVVDNVISLYAQRYQQKRIVLAKNFPSITVSVITDKKLLFSIFEQLLDNAYEYTPSEGEITVAIFYSEDSIHISIKDTGEGIAEEKRGLLFQQFSVLHDRAVKPSIGLGLYITKQLLQLIQSEIVYEENNPKGSVFIIKLHSLE